MDDNKPNMILPILAYLERLAFEIKSREDELAETINETWMHAQIREELTALEARRMAAREALDDAWCSRCRCLVGKTECPAGQGAGGHTGVGA